jgi:hypothetical protein
MNIMDIERLITFLGSRGYFVEITTIPDGELILYTTSFSKTKKFPKKKEGSMTLEWAVLTAVENLFENDTQIAKDWALYSVDRNNKPKQKEGGVCHLREKKSCQ